MSFVNSFLFVLFIGGCFSLFAFVPLWGPTAVFCNLARVPENSEQSAWPKFTVTDFAILFTHLAVANALISALYAGVPRSEAYFAILLALFTNLLIALVWIQCQRFMELRQIKSQRARLITQAFLYPLSVLIVGELLGTGMVLLGSLELFASGEPQRFFKHPMVISAAIGLATSIGALFVVRMLFRRYVMSAQDTAG